jgi:hypothetical protein
MYTQVSGFCNRRSRSGKTYDGSPPSYVLPVHPYIYAFAARKALDSDNLSANAPAISNSSQYFALTESRVLREDDPS